MNVEKVARENVANHLQEHTRETRSPHIALQKVMQNRYALGPSSSPKQTKWCRKMQEEANMAAEAQNQDSTAPSPVIGSLQGYLLESYL